MTFRIETDTADAHLELERTVDKHKNSVMHKSVRGLHGCGAFKASKLNLIPYEPVQLPLDSICIGKDIGNTQNCTTIRTMIRGNVPSD